MKFIDCDFPGKNKVRYSAVNEIMKILEQDLLVEGLSHLALLRYVEILIEDQEYNVKTGVFYDKTTNRKLNYKFLAGVAYSYILEHIDEFKLA